MTLTQEFPTLSVRRVCDLLGVTRSTVSYKPVAVADDSALRSALSRLALHWPTSGCAAETLDVNTNGKVTSTVAFILFPTLCVTFESATSSVPIRRKRVCTLHAGQTRINS
ncbi:hypothetical protein BH11PLA2_BH11PLA2_31120 [soil metagenome]